MKTLLTIALLLVAGPAWAQVTVKQSTCVYTATAPQTNADGTNLTDLKEYRIYYATTLAGLTATIPPFAVVPAPAADPAPGALLTWPCKTLPLGPGVITATAVDLGGNEGARVSVIPFSLQDDVPPSALTNPQLVGP